MSLHIDPIPAVIWSSLKVYLNVAFVGKNCFGHGCYGKIPISDIYWRFNLWYFSYIFDDGKNSSLGPVLNSHTKNPENPAKMARAVSFRTFLKLWLPVEVMRFYWCFSHLTLEHFFMLSMLC